MKSELTAVQAKEISALDSSFINATEIITKNYLDRLERYEIVLPSEEELDIDISECGKFYKLSKLVTNREENFLNKLTTIVNVVSAIDCSLTTIIKSNGYKIDFYFGIISKNARGRNEISMKRREADATAFKGAILGNLQGSEIEEVSKSQVDRFRSNILEGKDNCYASVSGLVALRDEEIRTVEGYVQGIENLVDSLKGQKYTIVMLADSVDVSEIQTIKAGYEILHTQLATFSKNLVTLNESENLSLSATRTEGFSEGISKGIAMTQSKTKSKHKSFGVSAGVGISMGVQANLGVNFTTGKAFSDTVGRTQSRTEMRQQSEAVTSGVSSSKTMGKSLQLSYENRSVKSLLDKIDKHLERLEECESFSAFDCAAYVIAKNRETALTVASNYHALIRGKNSGIQASHINLWYDPKETKILGRYMGALVHPRFWQNKNDKIMVTPSTIVSGDEIAVQIGLPKKSIAGVTVIPMAPFGRNVVSNSENVFELGSLYHMGHEEGDSRVKQRIGIDIDSLSMHTFITGSTGTGKSTAVYSILDKLMECNVTGSDSKKVSFLVVEPVKGEYKNRFGSYSNVSVYGTNYKKTPLLRIDPFSFPEDIHVLEHIDRLIEIFNVCWPMYAAMPAVLKDSIERAYIAAGWDLDTSECRYKNGKGQPMYPSFVDVLNQIHDVMEESQYSSDSKGDYKGALCTRLKSLTNGLYRQIFTSDELSADKLFDENVIVDLSRVGSSETKALIMGLLVMKLQEYRMANAGTGNASLKHVTVLEEAHTILKRTSLETSGESSNLLGKSVEMLANSIAEMRTYGEGVIIVDQSPGLLDLSVIRNTNTKIILRLPDLSDRELVGRAANLSDEQIQEISRLKTFVAAVYQNNWLEPVLCSIDTNFKESQLYQNKNVESGLRGSILKKNYMDYLLMSLEKRKKIDRQYEENLKDGIFQLQIPAEYKAAFLRYTCAEEKAEIQLLQRQAVYGILNAEEAFRLARNKEEDIHLWYRYMLELLDSTMRYFDKQAQMQIIVMLAREWADRERTKEAYELFDKLMSETEREIK